MIFQLCKGSLFQVESQFSFALCFVWPMALKTGVGKDRANVAIELNDFRQWLSSASGRATETYDRQSDPNPERLTSSFSLGEKIVMSRSPMLWVKATSMSIN